MNGTAIYLVLATLFVSQIFGLSLSIGQTLLLLITAVVLSFASAGVPSGGFFVLVAAFGVAGLPPSAYIGLTLVLAADWVVDRFRAVTNVWSDAVGAAVVAQSIGRGHHDVRESAAPERPSRDSRGGRPERTGRHEDRWRSARPERSSVASPASASPFAVTSAETDLETTPSESRPERSESETGRPGRPQRPEQSERGGRDRQRFDRRRVGEGGDRGERGERGRGDRSRRPDDRGRREGRPRFGDRGRDRDSDRSRHRGQRDDRRFRGGDRSGQEQSRPAPVDSEAPSELMAAVFGEPTEPVRNEDLFTNDTDTQESAEQTEMDSEYSPSQSEEMSPEEESSEQQNMDYGRSRSHRGERPESDSKPSSDDNEPSRKPEPESSETTDSETGPQEPPQFGRAPRKRLRH